MAGAEDQVLEAVVPGDPALVMAGGSLTVSVKAWVASLPGSLARLRDGRFETLDRSLALLRVPGRDQRPGTGLGLAIVREIAMQHGAEIGGAHTPSTRRPRCPPTSTESPTGVTRCSGTAEVASSSR